jgi:hypothetical protein
VAPSLPGDQPQLTQASSPSTSLHEKLLSVPSLAYRLGFVLGAAIAILPLIAIHVLA